jgi:hypothetical protein
VSPCVSRTEQSLSARRTYEATGVPAFSMLRRTTMAKLDKDLAGALKTLKSDKKKRMHFALVEKKEGEGTLIVFRSAVPQDKITEAQKDLGGGKIFKGECFTDPKTGEIIFETTTDPPSTKTLKAVIKLDAGLTFKLDSRKAPPKMIDAVMDAITADRPLNRLNDITNGADFKKAMSLGAAAAAILNKQVEEIKEAIKANDVKKTEDGLKQLKKRVSEFNESV